MLINVNVRLRFLKRNLKSVYSRLIFQDGGLEAAHIGTHFSFKDDLNLNFQNTTKRMSDNLTSNYLDKPFILNPNKPFIINQSIDINHKVFTPPSHSIEEYCNCVISKGY